MLDEERIEFVDLNHDDVYSRPQPPAAHRAPRAPAARDAPPGRPDRLAAQDEDAPLGRSDLFDEEPLRRDAGICYGWPKNVLHHAGIPASILDINGAVGPHLAIVDGIIGMEGDGPIMGTPRAAGVLVMGTNLPAVDATCARLMGIDPWRVAYLAAASGRLGPIAERHIRQRGEPIASLAQRFALLDHPSLAGLRS